MPRHALHYYNENDPGAAEWLRELIKCGAIPRGEVDTRSICEVTPSDLSGFRQCHFFAGIGGWALALKLAGWPESAPVWTGSCPCQPFSTAGKGLAFKDERHLWPVWARLIDACRPPFVFGEQVASAPARKWLARVFTDLERSGYCAEAADLPAGSVGAPHKRQRLYWLGYANIKSKQHDPGRSSATSRSTPGGPQEQSGPGVAVRHLRAVAGPWAQTVSILCRDGKRRRVPPESSLYPLAHGLPAGVVRLGLRGSGNAIVPQVAALFIRAAAGAILDTRNA